MKDFIYEANKRIQNFDLGEFEAGHYSGLMAAIEILQMAIEDLIKDDLIRLDRANEQ
jgi:hypothetical protein